MYLVEVDEWDAEGEICFFFFLVQYCSVRCEESVFERVLKVLFLEGFLFCENLVYVLARKQGDASPSTIPGVTASRSLFPEPKSLV